MARETLVSYVLNYSRSKSAKRSSSPKRFLKLKRSTLPTMISNR